MKKHILPFLFFLLSGLYVSAQTLKDAIKLTDNEQYEKAAAAFIALIQKEPKNGEVYFYFGENYFKQDEIDSALMFYTKGNTENPGFPLNQVGIGKVNWYKKKFDEAGKPFLTATTIVEDKSNKVAQPFKSTVYLKIAECYLNAPDKDAIKAKNYVAKALAINPKNADALILNGDAIFEESPANASKAIEEYKKAADYDKTSAKPLVRRGVFYMRCNNPSDAITFYTQAITLEPNFAPAYRERAEAYARLGKMDLAINDMEKYLELNKGSVSAKVRYGIFLYVAKKYSDALVIFRGIQKEVPSNMVVQRLMAYCYYESGDYGTGLSTIETYFGRQSAERIIPRDYEYYGKLYQKAGSDSLAVGWLIKAFEADPKNCDLCTEIGNIYGKLKKNPEAAVWYDKKIKCGGKVSANDYFYLGRSYYYIKAYQRADSAFAEYVKVQSKIPFGYIWRGRCAAGIDTGKVMLGLANQYYQMVIELVKPEDVDKSKKDLEEAYFYFGTFYLSSKEYAHAKCCYEKIVSLNTGSKEFKKSQDVLKVAPEFKGVVSATECIKK